MAVAENNIIDIISNEYIAQCIFTAGLNFLGHILLDMKNCRLEFFHNRWDLGYDELREYAVMT